MCVKSENTVLWTSTLVIFTLHRSYYFVGTLLVTFNQPTGDLPNHLQDTCNFIKFGCIIVTCKRRLGVLSTLPVCVAGKEVDHSFTSICFERPAGGLGFLVLTTRFGVTR